MAGQSNSTAVSDIDLRHQLGSALLSVSTWRSALATGPSVSGKVDKESGRRTNLLPLLSTEASTSPLMLMLLSFNGPGVVIGLSHFRPPGPWDSSRVRR